MHGLRENRLTNSHIPTFGLRFKLTGGLTGVSTGVWLVSHTLISFARLVLLEWAASEAASDPTAKE